MKRTVKNRMYPSVKGGPRRLWDPNEIVGIVNDKVVSKYENVVYFSGVHNDNTTRYYYLPDMILAYGDIDTPVLIGTRIWNDVVENVYINVHNKTNWAADTTPTEWVALGNGWYKCGWSITNLTSDIAVGVTFDVPSEVSE